MTTTFKDSVPVQKMEHETNRFAENKKGIENHKQAAIHHEAAAKYHHEAARFHEVGNHEKAYKSSLIAYGHQTFANELANEDLKHHTLNN
jgi:hypothetical protein